MADDIAGHESPEPAPAQAPIVYAPDGVHLLRTTQQIQYQLSQMADQKASMLLGITFVIFTISVSQAHNGPPPLPILVLGGAAFLAALLAVFAVLPSVKSGPTPGNARNILFFGAFTNMEETEYVEMLLHTITDTRAVYSAFAHDIYQNGQVLAGKKYRFLGYAYRTLLVGLILSLVAAVAPFVIKLAGF